DCLAHQRRRSGEIAVGLLNKSKIIQNGSGLKGVRTLVRFKDLQRLMKWPICIVDAALLQPHETNEVEIHSSLFTSVAEKSLGKIVSTLVALFRVGILVPILIQACEIQARPINRRALVTL